MRETTRRRRRGGNVKRLGTHDIASAGRTTKPKRGLTSPYWRPIGISIATRSGSPVLPVRRRTRGGALSTPRQVSTQRRGTTGLHSGENVQRKIANCVRCRRVQSIRADARGLCADCWGEVMVDE